MIVEFFFAVIIGISAGIFTGLIPGLHINLIAVLALSAVPFLPFSYTICMAIFLVAMSITHTFVDFIPSVFLGAPSEDTVMAALPGHRMFLHGRGFEAVTLSAIGSLIGLLVIITLSPFLFFVVPMIFRIIEPHIAIFLIIIVSFIILRSKNLNQMVWSTIIFLLSGSLGLLVFATPMKQPLLPMLSGLFGVSTLILSLKNAALKIPQLSEFAPIKKRVAIIPSTFAAIAGGIVTLFPALGPAQTAALVTSFWRNIRIRSYLILIGGINTASMAFSLITLYTINKARNGSIVAVQEILAEIVFSDMMLIGFAALTAGGLAGIITILLGKIFGFIMANIPRFPVTIGVVGFVLLLSVFFSGLPGIIVLIIATAIGLIPPLVGVSRSHAMGCLIVPIVLYSIL